MNESESVDWVQSALVMIAIGTVSGLCCLCCVFGVLFCRWSSHNFRQRRRLKDLSQHSDLHLTRKHRIASKSGSLPSSDPKLASPQSTNSIALSTASSMPPSMPVIPLAESFESQSRQRTDFGNWKGRARTGTNTTTSTNATLTTAATTPGGVFAAEYNSEAMKLGEFAPTEFGGDSVCASEAMYEVPTKDDLRRATVLSSGNTPTPGGDGNGSFIHRGRARTVDSVTEYTERALSKRRLDFDENVNRISITINGAPHSFGTKTSSLRSSGRGTPFGMGTTPPRNGGGLVLNDLESGDSELMYDAKYSQHSTPGDECGALAATR